MSTNVVPEATQTVLIPSFLSVYVAGVTGNCSGKEITEAVSMLGAMRTANSQAFGRSCSISRSQCFPPYLRHNFRLVTQCKLIIS